MCSGFRRGSFQHFLEIARHFLSFACNKGAAQNFHFATAPYHLIKSRQGSRCILRSNTELQLLHGHAVQFVRAFVFVALNHGNAGLNELAVNCVECFAGSRSTPNRINDFRRKGIILCNLCFTLRPGTERYPSRKVCSTVSSWQSSGSPRASVQAEVRKHPPESLPL